MTSFRDALERGDVPYLCRYWHEVLPGMPQPSPADAEMVMHHARTGAKSVSLKARAYSHRWLEERGLPSGLPDALKPKAERMYPREVGAVGISVNVRNEYLKPAAIEVREAMEYAVHDAYADGREEPEFVRQRMAEAKAKTWKALGLRMAR